MDLSIESRCIHLEHDHGENRFGAISFPIYQTATFSHPGLGESTDKGTFRKDGGCVGKRMRLYGFFIRNGSDHYRNGAV